MSAVVVPNVGEEFFLDQITLAGYTLRLYTNDVIAGLTSTQIDALTAASFTEATFTGYTSKALTGGSWVTTPDDPSTATYALQTFTRSVTGTAQVVRGYYVTRTTGGALAWFEHFDSAFTFTALGDALSVTPALALDDTSEGTMPTGSIIATGRTTAPTGWLLCDGAAVSRTGQAALFAAIGTNYGVGDGSTTFNLPDLRQRFPIGKAAAGTGSTLGGTGGTIDHTHGLDTSTSHAKVGTKAVVGNEFHMRRKTVTGYTATHGMTAANHQADTNAQTVGAELGGSSDTANPPFQAVNYIVKT